MINSATNQITNSGYTYDNAGNMTHDATAAYAYDGANRLTTINTTAAVYSYFGAQRIKKVLGSTTTRYIYSGSKPIAEYVNGANVNSPSAEYIYAGSQLLATIAGSTTAYHHPDHLSNRAEPTPREPGSAPLGSFLLEKPGTKQEPPTSGNSLGMSMIREPERPDSIMPISGTIHPHKPGS
jgi:hypothetical protein